MALLSLTSGGGGDSRITINAGIFSDLASLNIWGAANLSTLFNSVTQVTVATVGNSVYQWTGEDEPSSYPSGGSWTARSIEGPAGVPGEDGAILSFSSFTSRDNFFVTRPEMLENERPITVNVGNRTVQHFEWSGGSRTSYDPVADADMWLDVSYRTATDSLELDQIFTVSGGGSQVFITNEGSGNAFFTVQGFVGDHRRSERRITAEGPFARQYTPSGANPPTEFEFGGVRAASGTVAFNVNFDIQGSNPSLFGITFVPEEDYTGDLTYQISETDHDPDIVVFNQRLNVTLTQGVEFTQWFKFPFESAVGDNLNARLIKTGSGDLLVRPENIASDRPYTTSHVRVYTDIEVTIPPKLAAQLSPVVLGGSNVTVTPDADANTLTIDASGAGEANVQSNWSETDTNSDAFILNKPTIPTTRTDEEIRDVSYAGIVGGNGVTVTVDDTNDTVTISTDGGPPDAGPDSLFYGRSTTDNPATVDTSTLTSISATDPQTVQTGAAAQGDYFIILTSNTHDISTITDTVLQQDVTSIFVKTDNVRTIGATVYDSYVIGPLNAGVNESYVLEF